MQLKTVVCIGDGIFLRLTILKDIRQFRRLVMLQYTPLVWCYRCKLITPPFDKSFNSWVCYTVLPSSRKSWLCCIVLPLAGVTVKTELMYSLYLELKITFYHLMLYP
ncbi:hypothetical protein AQUCO_00500068v1 [Aquilegia coerulea]|uniref:Uncharacterized protein n=1 Tax=Aquilegia coerulea TaxID=218851 RepID=A0A2G5EQ65_AQUCA|nr:hypothetical protein AQUCO_00500068v1 [Aquilegia coerulea]